MMTARQHLALAVLVAVLLPVGSLIQGSGVLAFRMYATTPTWHITIMAWDAQGTPRPVSATALAAGVRDALGDVLAGADHWKYAPAPHYFAAHVADLARLACARLPGISRVRVTIDRRAASDAPLETSSAARPCP
jgi:hypothetical protein